MIYNDFYHIVKKGKKEKEKKIYKINIPDV